MWYAYPLDYYDYISEDVSDAFLVGILYYASIYKYDIRLDKPVSEKLLYQIERYYIETLVDTTDFFHKINIYCETSNAVIENANAVGTALSCGVDSFYSVMKTIETRFNSKK